MKTVKRIPFGQSNFERIRTENYLYVDKTRFIEMIENESNSYHFLIRPRKFGKTMFLSMLRHYYDVCYADRFDTLFGDLYIGKNPTPKRNSLFVIRFSFSGLDTSTTEKFQSSFTSAIRGSIDFFLVEHRFLLDNYKAREKELWTIGDVRGYIEYAFKIIDSFGTKAYIIIDEYDHFANDLIAMGTNLSHEQYKQLIWANGVVRDFYETLKDNAERIIDTIFITGVTPMMLDDVTSGFNISNNLSVKEKYCEILGFTEEEVEFVRQQAGVDKSLIKVDIKYLYNGYKFHVDAKNKLYNSSLINYFFQELLDEGLKIERLLDDNLKTDYGRIKNLLGKSENIEKLEEIIEFNQVQEKVVARFSIDKIHETKNFRSLLYYLGLVTIENENSIPMLKIPNYSVKTMYWEYMENILTDRHPEMSFDPGLIREGLTSLAFDGEYERFFDVFQQKFVSQLSAQDMKGFTEKHIKFMLLNILWQSNYYIPVSELENSQGYSDIYLQRRNFLYPRMQTDWIWELKYVKQSDARKEALIASKKNEAREQLQRYKTSTLFKDRKDMRYLAVVFIGKKKNWIEEIM